MPSETPVIALSIAQARASLGVSRTVLYHLISKGEIRTLKIGRRRLVRRAELERFLAAKEGAAAGAALLASTEQGSIDAN
jgi:excisionase family DNA binding protein